MDAGLLIHYATDLSSNITCNALLYRMVGSIDAHYAKWFRKTEKNYCNFQKGSLTFMQILLVFVNSKVCY